MNAIHLVGVCIAAVACCIDVREHRIPNSLTFGAAAAGIIFHTVVGGGDGLTGALLGWLTGAAIFFLPFALGGLGAGDVKLIAALGAWFVWPDALWLGLFTGIAGGVIAVAVALSRGYLRRALENIALLLMHWRVAGLRALPELTIQHPGAPKLAYGVSIFAGTVVTVWLR